MAGFPVPQEHDSLFLSLLPPPVARTSVVRIEIAEARVGACLMTVAAGFFHVVDEGGAAVLETIPAPVERNVPALLDVA